jgi:hypothetical protein
VLGLTTACVNQGGLGTPRTGASTTTTDIDTDDQPTVALPPSNPVVSSDPANPTQEGSTIFSLPKDLVKKHILSCLSIENIIRLSGTCTHFHNIFKEPDYLRELSEAFNVEIHRFNDQDSVWVNQNKIFFKPFPRSLYPLVRGLSNILPSDESGKNSFVNMKKLEFNDSSWKGIKEQLGDPPIAFITEALKKNIPTTIEEFKVSILCRYVNVKNQEIHSIVNWLKTLKNLKKLDLSSTTLQKNVGQDLAEILKNNPKLQKLSLANTGIESQALDCLVEALKTNPSLQSLDLSNNNMKNKEAKFLAKLLTYSSLQELDLGMNYIGMNYISEAAKDLAEGLKINKTLKKLYLSMNALGLGGAKCIAEALKNNKTLLELDLKGNRIGDEGAGHIAEALKLNTGLKYIIKSQ